MFARSSVNKEPPAKKPAKSAPAFKSSAEYFSAHEESEGTFASSNFAWSLANIPVFSSGEEGRLEAPNTRTMASTLQPREVGGVKDPLEREADRLAEQVMRTWEPATAESLPGRALAASRGESKALGNALGLQRKCECSRAGTDCESCKKEREQGLQPVNAAKPSQACAFGNQAAVRIQGRGSISGNGEGPTTKHMAARVIGPSDDPAEREADAIGDAIIAGKAHGKPSQVTAGPIQAKGTYGGPCSSRGGETEEREPDETPVQAKLEGGSASSNGALSSRLEARHGGGEPLPSAIRRNFEPQLAVPLGGVQVHRDAEAGELARSIGALAFAAGQDVYFAPGRYAPDTPDGARLIAHELVHVAQQGSGSRTTPIRRFTLKGFDPAQEKQMRAAVHSAKSKIGACFGKGIPVHDIADILRGLDKADYVFVQDLDDCGESNPLTDKIKIGPSAFNHAACCDLDSTLAHECAHSFAWGFEGFARKVECKCFRCSCS